MKRVHLITDHFAAGGIGVVVEHEAISFSELGWQVNIVCNSEGALPYDQWELMSPEIFDRIKESKINLLIKGPSELSKYIDSIPANELIILHTSWRGRGFSCLPYNNWENKKSYFFVHNSSSTDRVYMNSPLLNNLTAVKGIFYGSRFVYNDLLPLVPNASYFRVSYGVEPKIFHCDGAKPFHLRHRRVLYIGRLLKEKGAHLLENIAELIRAHNIELLVHGAFREKEINPMNSITLASNNAVTPNEMANLYRGSTIILLPSLRGEGQPLCVLEALSCGTAVVATNYALGGFADTSFAHIVEPSPEKIAITITEIMNSLETTNYKLKLGKEAVKELTWKNHTINLLNYIQP